MKIEIEEIPTPAKPTYPRLMKSVTNGQIILFTNSESGTVLKQGSMITNYSVGHHSGNRVSCEDTNFWTPFTGKITLAND